MIEVYDLASVLVSDASAKSFRGKKIDAERIRRLKSLCEEAGSLYTELNAYTYGVEVDPDTGFITVCIDCPSIRTSWLSRSFSRAVSISSSISFSKTDDEDFYGVTVSFTVPGVWRD